MKNWIPPTLFPLFLLALAGSARAEDPVLGVIKGVKCVNCMDGLVALAVHDNIDNSDYNLLMADSVYNRIIARLDGRAIFDRDGKCFYWRPSRRDSLAMQQNPSRAQYLSQPRCYDYVKRVRDDGKPVETARAGSGGSGAETSKAPSEPETKTYAPSSIDKLDPTMLP